jgi:magnesium transporter
MSYRRQPRTRKPIKPLFRSIPEGGGTSSPGSTNYIGDKAPVDAVMSLIQYDQNEASFVTPDHEEEMIAMLEDGMVNWININGLGNQSLIKHLGVIFKLDSLTLEDIFNTKHRPKVEDFGHYVLVITKMLNYRADGVIEYEHVALVLTSNAVLTFQENPGDCFGPVRERIRTGTGRIRRLKSGYLAYALIDVIVDNYFSLLEVLGDRIEEFESSSIFSRTTNNFMSSLQDIKSDLNKLRRIVWPVRDSIGELLHSESELFDPDLGPFLRDLQENSIQVLEALESYRETVSGIQEVYLASVSNRMNEVIKVLTIISTIFMPLTFIAGVYGMNFRYMPELQQRWAYPSVLGLMGFLFLGMLYYFKRKKWI